MNRRSFLSMMGFVAPAVIVKPTYFFAPGAGWVRPDGIMFGGVIHPYFTENTIESQRTVTGIQMLFDPKFLRNLKANTPFVDAIYGTSTLKMPWVEQ